VEDSKKTEASGGTLLPPGVTTITIRNPLGKDGVETFRQVQKDASGKFVKKAKPPIPTAEFVRQRRKRLAQVRTGQDCFNDMTEDMSIVEELLECMHLPIVCDKYGMPDSKMVMAKAKVAETIWLFSHGKPATAESDLEALKHSGVEIVFMNPTLPNAPIEVAKEEVIPAQPTFAEVLDVKTNPQT
jgi:hypothetical protein